MFQFLARHASDLVEAQLHFDAATVCTKFAPAKIMVIAPHEMTCHLV